MVRVPSDNFGMFGNDHSCTLVWCCCFWHRLYTLLLWSFSAFSNDRPHCESVALHATVFFILLSLFLCFRGTNGNPREARLKPWRWIQSREDRISVNSFLRWDYSDLVVWVVIVGNIAESTHLCRDQLFAILLQSQSENEICWIGTISYYVLTGPE